jgi:Mak10 subunit, NatC N(alpha)-terminal acetyltransferase
MDPKTDSGMILTEDDAKEFVPETSLLPEEIIWIIDQLLAREVSSLKRNCG